jgi:hypothetical protein
MTVRPICRSSRATSVGDVQDRAKAMAAACLAILAGDILAARRWAVRAVEIERQRGPEEADAA